MKWLAMALLIGAPAYLMAGMGVGFTIQWLRRRATRYPDNP